MSSNLLKWCATNFQQDETRVIQSNELLAKRMEEIEKENKKKAENAGFISGIAAETIDADSMLGEDDAEGFVQGNIIKAREEVDSIMTAARQEAESILEQARIQAMQLEKDARARAEQERMQMLQQASSQGYQDGMDKARQEAAKAEQELKARARQLEEEYQAIVDELEPQFVDTITGIYEHIFHVELHSYREVLGYLISATMRKIEGNRNFMIHVSKEDYPYISMQKKQIVAGISSSNTFVEVVEDVTLAKNQCLIETEGGIFDCGLETQLTELRQKLKLLSYEK